MYLAIVSFFLHLWQSFFALHPWRYVTARVLALVAFIKRKAIGAATSAMRNTAKEKFFGWFDKNLPRQKRKNEKTYRGIFMGFFQYESPPHEWFFAVCEDDIEHKVPTMSSNLLTGVQHGSVVEVGTEVLPGARVEMIRRVRVLSRARNPDTT